MQLVPVYTRFRCGKVNVERRGVRSKYRSHGSARFDLSQRAVAANALAFFQQRDIACHSSNGQVRWRPVIMSSMTSTGFWSGSPIGSLRRLRWATAPRVCARYSATCSTTRPSTSRTRNCSWTDTATLRPTGHKLDHSALLDAISRMFSTLRKGDRFQRPLWLSYGTGCPTTLGVSTGRSPFTSSPT